MAHVFRVVEFGSFERGDRVARIEPYFEELFKIHWKVRSDGTTLKPTYSQYADAAILLGAETVFVKQTPDFHLDLDAPDRDDLSQIDWVDVKASPSAPSAGRD